MNKDQLKKLAGFLPAFEDPEFRAGEVRGGVEEPGVFSMPYFSLGEVASDFYKMLYDEGWILMDFDWPVWGQSAEAITLCEDAAALARAEAQQLAKLLTVVVRQDRFASGAIFEAFETGLMLRIVRRAAVLFDQDDPASMQNGDLLDGQVS